MQRLESRLTKKDWIFFMNQWIGWRENLHRKPMFFFFPSNIGVSCKFSRIIQFYETRGIYEIISNAYFNMRIWDLQQSDVRLKWGSYTIYCNFNGEIYEKPLDLGIHHWTYQNPMHCVQIEHPTSLYCRWWIGVVFSSKNIYWSPQIELHQLHQFWFPTVSKSRPATVPEWSRKLCPGGGNWCVEGTTERVWTAWGRGSTLAPTFIPPPGPFQVSSAV